MQLKNYELWLASDLYILFLAGKSEEAKDAAGNAADKAKQTGEDVSKKTQGKHLFTLPISSL